MIIEFSVKNFRSFRKLATLSCEAESLKAGEDCVIPSRANINLLPAIGIFGHNASGKSNLVKALAFMQWAMLNSDYLNRPTTKAPLLKPFLLNLASCKEPSYFQIVLWDPDHEIEYRYGFEINSERITSEWLESIGKAKKNRRQRMIFQREGQNFSILDENIKEDINPLINKILPTALALTVFAQFANPIALQVIKLIDRPSLVIFDAGEYDPTNYAMQRYHEDPGFAAKVLKLLKRFDLAIQDLTILKQPLTDAHLKNLPNEFRSLLNKPGDFLRTVTHHKLYGSDKEQFVEFDFHSQESFGTRRLFGLIALLVQALDSGCILVFDEFGSSIHPFMSREIVTLFQNRATNPKGAQLIFCSHETYLLSNQVGLDAIRFGSQKKTNRKRLLCVLYQNIKYEANMNLKKTILKVVLVQFLLFGHNSNTIQDV